MNKPSNIQIIWEPLPEPDLDAVARAYDMLFRLGNAENRPVSAGLDKHGDRAIVQTPAGH